MTADQLAKELGISRPWLFHLKRKFAAEAPKDFHDIEAWETFVEFTKTQVKTRGRKSLKGPVELSDYRRLVRLRGDKLELERQMLSIELGATERRLIPQEEITAVFGKLGTVLRGRLIKARNDLPSALLGLNEAAMDAILREKFDFVMSEFSLPADFWSVRGLS
jgi:hypothetical protein